MGERLREGGGGVRGKEVGEGDCGLGEGGVGGVWGLQGKGRSVGVENGTVKTRGRRE